MSEAVSEHRAAAPLSLGVAVLTVSDSRTLETDTSGALVVERLESAGHRVVQREILPDEPGRLCPLLEQWRDRSDVDAVLVTGGTGISPRDQTFEAVSGLLSKSLPGFGELFRMLSYQEVGPAAMLSRAVAGLMDHTVVFVMPGSRAAVQLAMDKLILAELAHAVGLANPSRGT